MTEMPKEVRIGIESCEVSPQLCFVDPEHEGQDYILKSEHAALQAEFDAASEASIQRAKWIAKAMEYLPCRKRKKGTCGFDTIVSRAYQAKVDIETLQAENERLMEVILELLPLHEAPQMFNGAFNEEKKRRFANAREALNREKAGV